MIPKLPIIPILLAALVALGGYHKVAMWRADKRQAGAVAAMESLMKTKQEKSSKMIQEEENENVEKIDTLTNRVAHFERLYRKAKLSSNCTASVSDDPDRQDGQSDGDGQLIARLFDYALRSEKDRLKVEGCQKFIRGLVD